MKRSTLLAGLTILLLAGCQSDQSEAYQPYVSMSQMNSEENADHYSGSGVFYLGAGDTLGREIYVNYLASLNLESDEYYATVESDAERIEK